METFPTFSWHGLGTHSAFFLLHESGNPIWYSREAFIVDNVNELIDHGVEVFVQSLFEVFVQTLFE